MIYPSDEQQLTEWLERLEQKLDAVIAKKAKKSGRYGINDFCLELNLTPYRLRKLYSLYKLPIPKPWTENGHRPVFGDQDLIAMQTFLDEHPNA